METFSALLALLCGEFIGEFPWKASDAENISIWSSLKRFQNHLIILNINNELYVVAMNLKWE